MMQTSDFEFEEDVSPVQEEGESGDEQDYQPEDDFSSDSEDTTPASSSGSDEPPEWLRKTFGEDDRSEEQFAESDDAADDELATQITQRESPLGGVVFPDWLTGSNAADEEQPPAEAAFSSLDETLITDRTTLEAMEEVDQLAGTAIFDASELNLAAEGEVAEDDSAAKGTTDEVVKRSDSEEFEDELKWLEDLATSHDVSDERYAYSGSAGDLSPMAEEDYIPDWLKSEIDANDKPSGQAPTSPVTEDVTEFTQQDRAQQQGEEELLGWLAEEGDGEPTAPGVDEDVDLDWFNRIVEGDESAIDELLAIQGISLDVAEEPLPGEWSDDQDSWLDELGQIDDVFEDTPVEEVVDEAVPDIGEVYEPEAEAASETVPTDPDEAMAWLEQLALDQSLADDQPGSEPRPIEMDESAYSDLEVEDLVSQGDFAVPVPEDPDEAMAWLEQLASEEGDLDEKIWSSDEDAPDESEIAPVEPADEELEAALASIAGLTLPSDYDEALAWLDELALNAQLDQDIDSAMDGIFDSFPEELEDEREIYKAEIAEYLDEDEHPEPEIGSESLQLAAMAAAAELLELESDGLPDQEEFEEAFADISTTEPELWDDGEKGPQTEAIDETLPGTLTASMLFGEEEEESDIDFLDDEFLETAISDIESLDEDSEGESIEQTMIGTAAAAAIMAEELLVEDEEGEASPEASLEASLESGPGEAELVDLFEPGAEVDAAEDADDLHWLSSLEEANVTGWLVAEQALLAEEKESDADLDRMAADRPPEPGDEEDELLTPERFFSTHQFDDHGFPGLASAQAALVSGQFSKARQEYSALLDSKDMLPYAIADLEIVAEVTDNEPNFMKILGDAYSRNGQLTKAIEIYRLALDKL